MGDRKEEFIFYIVSFKCILQNIKAFSYLLFSSYSKKEFIVNSSVNVIVICLSNVVVMCFCHKHTYTPSFSSGCYFKNSLSRRDRENGIIAVCFES